MTTIIEKTADELLRELIDGTDELLTCKNVVLHSATQPDALLEFHHRIASGGDFTPEEKVHLGQVCVADGRELPQFVQVQKDDTGKLPALQTLYTVENTGQEMFEMDQFLTSAELLTSSSMPATNQPVALGTGSTACGASPTPNQRSPQTQHPKLKEFIHRIASGGKMTQAELLKMESDWQWPLPRSNTDSPTPQLREKND